MYFISEVYWNKGCRDMNQDSVSLQEAIVDGEKVIFGLVCDGIGGLACGELASGYAAERMTEWFHKELLFMLLRNKRTRAILHAGIKELYSCNETMRDYGLKKQLCFGTTLTMLLIHKKRYMLWHYGDSRAYRIKGRNRIRQLTKDHTAGEDMLTRCVGSFSWKQPDVSVGKAGRNSTFLICSDGFRHIISEQRIGEALAPGELADERQILVRMTEIAEYSIAHGEKDNISAIVIKTG